MGGYACSSWYFLRFTDPHDSTAPFSREAADYWMPVDMYVGGTEHAVSHLLYSRFWTKVMFDAGLVGFDEPFDRLRNQGSLLAWTPGRRPEAGDDGDDTEAGEQIIDWKVLKPEERASYPEDKIIWRWARMSKSKGNAVTPDQAALDYGADSLRLYEMFVAPFEENVQWSEEGIRGSSKFLGRVYRLVAQHSPPASPSSTSGETTPAERTLRRKTHQTILKVGDDLENFRFNTAIAAMMEWVNTMYEVANGLKSGEHSAALDEAIGYLVRVLAPFAPHLADEMWTEGLGQTGFLYKHSWPQADLELAKNDEITLIVQVNGKVRDKITVAADADENALREIALASPRVQEMTNGKTIQKVIVVPGRLVNLVVS